MRIQKKRLQELSRRFKIELEEDPEPFRTKFKDMYCAAIESKMLCYDCSFCTVPIRVLSALHKQNEPDEVLKNCADIMVAVTEEAEYKEKRRNPNTHREGVVDWVMGNSMVDAIKEKQKKQLANKN